MSRFQGRVVIFILATALSTRPTQLEGGGGRRRWWRSWRGGGGAMAAVVVWTCWWPDGHAGGGGRTCGGGGGHAPLPAAAVGSRHVSTRSAVSPFVCGIKVARHNFAHQSIYHRAHSRDNAAGRNDGPLKATGNANGECKPDRNPTSDSHAVRPTLRGHRSRRIAPDERTYAIREPLSTSPRARRRRDGNGGRDGRQRFGGDIVNGLRLGRPAVLAVRLLRLYDYAMWGYG